MGNYPLQKKQVIDIIDGSIDYWTKFIELHGQGEDAAVSVWTIVAELDTIKEKINDVYNGS